jgi:hypothetical protein
MKKIIGLILITTLIIILTGCSDAETVNYNISNDADNFKIYRHIVFVNNVTGEYLLEITGYCNITADIEDKQLETICKDNNGGYIKNFLGVNETTTYFVEQIEPRMVNDKHYVMIIKPSVLIPFVEVR